MLTYILITLKAVFILSAFQWQGTGKTPELENKIEYADQIGTSLVNLKPQIQLLHTKQSFQSTA